MSMLSHQADELRNAAKLLNEIGISVGYKDTTSSFIANDIDVRMEEAADTIIGPRNRLQELQGVGGESRYTRLFGTPERAAQTLHRFCADCFCGDCSTCGVPEWADYTRDYDALLEWLRGEDE